MRTLQTFLCSMAALVLVSCSNDPLEVDVSNIELTIEVERWDQQWSEINPIRFRKFHAENLEKHPQLYKHYVEDVLNLGTLEDTNLYMSIRSFVTHPDFQEVFKEVATTYPELDQLEASLELAWKHYKYYFPERVVPQHMTCVGGFNAPYILTEQEVGICLEMFLGNDCRFYEYLQVPVYLRQRFTESHLVPWLIKGWLETEFPMNLETDPTMLETIVHQGKILYMMDAVLPKTPDSLKIGYSSQEMNWARDHERMVWAHFIDEELLFSADATEIAKFTNDGPFTVDLVKESPSRMGHFVGWQLVRAYMAQQESVNLNELIEASPEEILKTSKYKP